MASQIKYGNKVKSKELIKILKKIAKNIEKDKLKISDGVIGWKVDIPKKSQVKVKAIGDDGEVQLKLSVNWKISSSEIADKKKDEKSKGKPKKDKKDTKKKDKKYKKSHKKEKKSKEDPKITPQEIEDVKKIYAASKDGKKAWYRIMKTYGSRKGKLLKAEAISFEKQDDKGKSKKKKETKTIDVTPEEIDAVRDIYSKASDGKKAWYQVMKVYGSRKGKFLKEKALSSKSEDKSKAKKAMPKKEKKDKKDKKGKD